MLICLLFLFVRIHVSDAHVSSIIVFISLNSSSLDNHIRE
jgi:hypothetical protein